jgi:hypothetical protein
VSHGRGTRFVRHVAMKRLHCEVQGPRIGDGTQIMGSVNIGLAVRAGTEPWDQ